MRHLGGRITVMKGCLKLGSCDEAFLMVDGCHEACYRGHIAVVSLSEGELLW